MNIVGWKKHILYGVGFGLGMLGAIGLGMLVIYIALNL